MKPCQNMFCPLNASGLSGNCLNEAHTGSQVKYCNARKRYNRTIAPLLALWNALVIWGGEITDSPNGLLRKLCNAIDRLNKERNKYQGRK